MFPQLLTLAATATSLGATFVWLVVSQFDIEPAVTLLASLAGFSIALQQARSKSEELASIRSKRDSALKNLGMVGAYATSKEDDYLLTKQIAGARRIKVLAVNAEMILRNLPTPFKDALKNGSAIEFLVCAPDCDLVADMEQMEIADGRSAGRSIIQCIRETEPALRGILQDCHSEVPRIDLHKLGKISIGYFRTQYRESMIICDDKWVWWTPHLNPARGADRPTFVFEGDTSKMVQLCVRHFESIKKMSEMQEVKIAP